MSDTPPPLQPESPPYAAPSPGQPSGSGSGKKWGIGCGIGCLAALIVGVIVLVVGFNMAKNAVVAFVEKSTSDQQVELVRPEIPPATVESAVKRFDDFTAAMEGGEVTTPMVLTDEDINALIANHPQFSAISDSMVVSIEEDRLTSQVSIGLDDLDLPESFLTEAIAGKFFNGEVTLRLGMLAGRPAMYIEGLSVGGTPVPAQFMSELSKENILAEASADPELQKTFDKIKELKVENGVLTIVPNAGGQ